MDATMLIIILITLLVLIANVPIAFALSTAGFLILFFYDSSPLSFFIQTSFSSSSQFTLLAIPFFILAGDIMSSGGIAARLIDFIRSIIGSATGGLGVITILSSLIFAAISGSGTATVAAIGGIMIPYMYSNGYNKNYAVALSATSGAMGPIIPPSIIFILYGIMANVSIGDMFIAGLFPGLLMAAALLVTNYIISKKEGFVVEKVENKESFLSSLNKAKYGLLAPVIILGGIYGGIVTPTEAAVVAVVYSIIISVFVYKELKLKELPAIFMKSSLMSGQILIFISTASFFGRMISLEGVPQALATAVSNFSTNYIVILIIINLLLLVVGMFIETVAAVILFVPLLLPIINNLGIDPVHFGIIVCLNLSLGLITPPLGINNFVAASIAGINFERTIKYLIPLFISILIVLMLVTFIPQISLFLPELLSSR